MKATLFIVAVLFLAGGSASAGDLTAARGWILEHESGVTVELWSDEDTWQSNPNLAEYGHSYRKLRVIDPVGALMLEQVLPVDRALDFAYRLSFEAGTAPLVVLEGAFQFYLLDLTDPDSPALSGPVRPLLPEEIIGVDGRSGQIVDLWISDDGRLLGGGVIHGGCFIIDVSIPADPKRVGYTQDWRIEGSDGAPQCRPQGTDID